MSITYESHEKQTEWLVRQGLILKEECDVEDKSIISQAKVLYEVWSIWDGENNHEGLSLKDDAKYPWNYDFYNWAKSYTKQRALKEPANETINNKITIYRDWIAEQIIEYPEFVYVPKRNEYGKIIDNNLIQEDNWEKVPFNPQDCDYGKLLVARGSARRGEMSPEAWAAMIDTRATVSELKTAMRGDEERQKNKDDFSIYEQDGIIYGCSHGKKIPVLQALLENSADDLFLRTISHILRAAGLSVPQYYQR